MNDTDVELNTLTVTQVATTSGGTIVPVNGTNVVTTALGGTVVMNPDGTFSYTAPQRNHADVTPDIDSFVYKASDGSGLSAWTTVDLTITDTGPTALADVDSVGRNSTATGNVVTGAGGVTADTLAADSVTVSATRPCMLAAGTWTLVTTNGTLALTQATGAYTFTSDVPAVVPVNTNVAGWQAADVAVYDDSTAPTNPYSGGTPALNLNLGDRMPRRPASCASSTWLPTTRVSAFNSWQARTTPTGSSRTKTW